MTQLQEDAPIASVITGPASSKWARWMDPERFRRAAKPNRGLGTAAGFSVFAWATLTTLITMMAVSVEYPARLLSPGVHP